jgi:hypothetical protein
MIGLSCADSPRQKSTEPINNEQQAGKINKPTGNFPDTLTIHAPAAVFYNPDSLQLEKIKKIIQKNEFESEVHNCFYLVRNAQIVLKKDWPQVHIIETSRNRWLLFIKDDKSHTLIDLDNKGDMCGLFLFDGKKEPELADMMNIDTALGFYFSK